ncbi:MAG: sigma-70 family RNA polymerase sigma factor [Chloroflexi bacterium]|nr:sigma-70 family RNA polymerase sigma factor [Chloroflexota bacterium]MCI0580303.1 sigma-70 family RNA polymerase sigma factor [Chloroflexota bacterium]MCI0648078.1 sigma-70 family RNA polymerase sigma factor [Chloroflexota bacterium]MCI0730909.1 sigma-70 family RNA polymerase sigma factor [Chloroflexota bacterium]
MRARTNDEWLRALNQPGEARNQALVVLRDYLLRAVLIYLRGRRSDLSGWTAGEIRRFAEDMTQEALLSIQANLDTFRGESKFTTWAYRFVINQAATELRLARYSELSLEALQEQESVSLLSLLRQAPQVGEPGITAERIALLQELEQIINRELTDRQRAAIIGVHLQGRSMDDVANELGTTRNALYKLLHDARLRIKERLRARHLSAGDILALFES